MTTFLRISATNISRHINKSLENKMKRTITLTAAAITLRLYLPLFTLFVIKLPDVQIPLKKCFASHMRN